MDGLGLRCVPTPNGLRRLLQGAGRLGNSATRRVPLWRRWYHQRKATLNVLPLEVVSGLCLSRSAPGGSEASAVEMQCSAPIRLRRLFSLGQSRGSASPSTSG